MGRGEVMQLARDGKPVRDIEAEITFLPTEHDGRQGPVQSGYRGQFYYDGHDCDAPHEYPDVGEVSPGQTVRAYLRFLSPQLHLGKLHPGKVFLIREGNKTVGYGTVRALMDLAWSAQQALARSQLQSTTALEAGAHVVFDRNFHVEKLKGGMNRLLLRALPTAENPKRVEVFFQYAQHIDAPMTFNRLEVHDVTHDQRNSPKYVKLIDAFPKCRIFRLDSDGEIAGLVLAAGCSFGEDDGPSHAPSIFPLME
jgi:hypothetical protein